MAPAVHSLIRTRRNFNLINVHVSAAADVITVVGAITERRSNGDWRRDSCEMSVCTERIISDKIVRLSFRICFGVEYVISENPLA